MQLLQSNLKKYIRKLARKAGFDIIRGSHPAGAILCNQGISLILDVGANVGQYGLKVRRLGYEGRIVSFEPVSAPFAQLAKNAENDPLWEVANYGLGDTDGEAMINVSQNSEFSSILNNLQITKDYFAESAQYVAQEQVVIKKLDSIFENYCQADDKVLLKIDTQGYEKNVLAGAEASLKHIAGLQVELSFIQLYEGELLIKEMLDYLDKKGFTIVWLEPISQTGKLLQGDGIFLRVA